MKPGAPDHISACLYHPGHLGYKEKPKPGKSKGAGGNAQNTAPRQLQKPNFC